MEYILDRPGFSHLIYSILNHLDIPTLARLELVCKSWRNFIMREQVWQYVLDNRIAIEGSLIRNRLSQHYLPYEDIQRDRENGDFESASKMLRKIVWRIERGFLYEWKNNYADLQKIKDARFIRAMTLKGQYVLYVMGGAVIVRPLFPIMQESKGPSKAEQEVKTIPKVELSGCHRREVFELDVHGKFVATVGRDRKLVLWTVDWNMKDLLKEAIDVQYVVNEAHRRLITAVKFIDTHTLATSSRDHTIKIWKIKKSADGAKYSLYSKQTLHNHTHSVWCIDVTKDFIVSGSTDKIQRAWKFDGMQWIEHHAFRGHSSGVRCVMIFQLNPMFFVSGDSMGEVKVWNLETKAIQYEVPELESQGWFRHYGAVVCLSETPGILAVMYGNIRIGLYNSLNVATSLDLFRIIDTTPIAPQGFVRSIAMTKFQLLLATVTGQNDIVVLDFWDEVKCQSRSELNVVGQEWQFNLN